MRGSSFTGLEAWRQARRLVTFVSAFTNRFPEDEKFVLVSQMRRAAHSVHSNIAERNGRLSNGAWQHFLGQARGSLMEIESDAILAFDLKYCTHEEGAALTEQIRQVARLVNGLLRKSAKGFATKKFKPAANR